MRASAFAIMSSETSLAVTAAPGSALAIVTAGSPGPVARSRMRGASAPGGPDASASVAGSACFVAASIIAHGPSGCACISAARAYKFDVSPSNCAESARVASRAGDARALDADTRAFSSA